MDLLRETAQEPKFALNSTKAWIWDPGSNIWDPGSDIRNPGSSKTGIWDPGSKSLDAGHRIQDLARESEQRAREPAASASARTETDGSMCADGDHKYVRSLVATFSWDQNAFRRCNYGAKALVKVEHHEALM